MMAVAVTAAVRVHTEAPAGPAPVMRFRDDEARWIVGRVREVARRSENGFKVVLSDLVVAEKGALVPLVGALALEIVGPTRAGALSEGAEVRAWARLRRVHPAPNPGGGDPAPTLLNRGIRYRARTEDAVITRPASGLVDPIRDRFRDLLGSVTPETATLLEAMVLGDQAVLDRERQERWRLAGITHILSISGLHVGVVAIATEWLVRMLLSFVAPIARRWSTRRLGAAIGLVIAWGYVIVAGSPIAAVRSAWMVTSLFGARALLRYSDGLTALGLAAALTVLEDPWAVKDPAFQLSYAAVLGLIAAAPAARTLSEWLLGVLGPRLGRLVNMLITPLVGSLACTIATLPILVVHFGVLSWSGLLTNVVAVPLSSIAIVLPGVVALVGGAAGWHIDCLWISDLLTPWLEDIARWGAALPTFGAHGSGARRLVGLSIGAVLLLLWMSRGARGRRVFLTGLVATTIGLWPASAPPQGELRLVFLAVGHGDALVITLPDGRHLLVDGGGDPLGLRDVGKDIVLPSLAALGVDRLHAVVLSHPHPDHYRGLVAVAADLVVSEFWWNGEIARDPSFALLLDHFRAQGTTERRFCEGPLMLTLGDGPDEVVVDVFHPLAPETGRGCVAEDLHANDNSLVLKLRYGAFSALLPGDLEREAETRVVGSNADLRATVLKVPHHGSKTSSTDAFLDRVAPELAISGSADQGRFAFPDPEVLQRYADRSIPLWITGRHGAVTITTDGHQWQYRGESDDSTP